MRCECWAGRRRELRRAAVSQLVMAGHSRPKDGVASARLCPAIHDFLASGAKDVDARVKPGHDDGWSGEGSVPQKLTGLVQRAKRQPGFRERFGGAFLAVDH